MSIGLRVLGNPESDNALLVEVDSGQSVERLLFDCGEGCLSGLTLSEILEVDHVCFSHFHMDHVCGFDSFFRAAFNRESRPNVIWGPPGTGEIMHHRFRSYLWNLHETMDAAWRVVDITPGGLRTKRFELKEAFQTGYEEGCKPWNKTIWEGNGYTLDAMTMDHRTPSMAYVVRERARCNFDTGRLAAMGLKPGAWMKSVKDTANPQEMIEVEGRFYRAEELRNQLLVNSRGDSAAYLTDFLLDDPAMERLIPFLEGCRTIVCESQYRHADLELAQRHHHMTPVQAAHLAKAAGADHLILFHLSSRYTPDIWKAMLREAQAVFPATCYPPAWGMNES